MSAKRSANLGLHGAPARVPLVLIADADDDTRALYRRAFESAAYDVTEAADGREALTKALVRRPALIVTELVLPRVDGFALCEILRSDRETANLPILIVTADARPAQLTRACRAGASTVLVKPVAIDSVVIETQRLLAEGCGARQAIAVTDPRASRGESERPLAQASRRPPRSLVKAFSRFATTTPPLPPPAARCPSCDRPLTYERSHVGGVNQRDAEQWDDFVCSSCGPFQYRHRTRRLSQC